MELYKKVYEICYECDSKDIAIEIVSSLSHEQELVQLLDEYNWGDSNEIPLAVINHPKCCLGIALKVYWMSGGDYYPNLENGIQNEAPENVVFSLVKERISSGYYKVAKVPFTESFNKVQLYKFKRLGLPEIFYTAFCAN
ncbi:DUF4274 domain-containing protein [Vibrio genomosp. F10]|uniref:DUF4274 domain-containing protein n=1 Tax=Vibrio genomosp. F10 TaxID=723171 RepID=UPI00037A54A3|nr:DUF4274 domain-containing protein [Vibrio genomosp. F10]OEF05829.1 hypothetical protein A1QI_18815 [Vibrio genomosp. F10 str. 9ZB36]